MAPSEDAGRGWYTERCLAQTQLTAAACWLQMLEDEHARRTGMLPDEEATAKLIATTRLISLSALTLPTAHLGRLHADATAT